MDESTATDIRPLRHDRRGRLHALAFEMLMAQNRGDQAEVDAIHRQMHALDPSGRYFQCDNCPITKEQP